MGKFNRGKIMIPGLDEVGPDTVIENQTERGKGLGSGLLSNVSQTGRKPGWKNPCLSDLMNWLQTLKIK